MKNLSKLMAIVGVLGVTLSVQAMQNATFELFNKDAESVRIASFNIFGGNIIANNFKSNTIIPTNHQVHAQIEVTDPTKFLILLEIKRAQEGGARSYLYTIRPGSKTVFVSFTTKKSPALYPETGPLKGLLGKTESGLSLKNNLAKSNIQEGDTRTAKEKIGSFFGF